jgi:S-adenosylmethionine decarboxylase
LTELGLEEALQFVRTESFVSAAQTTIDSGITLLKPKADIDDYVFEPCGYSMNGIEGSGLVTVHITPEPGHSYASVELSGYAEDIAEGPGHLLETALRIFRPGRVSIALTSSAGPAPALAPASVKGGEMMACLSNSTQNLECGGAVSFYTLAARKEGQEPSSPTSILHNSSFLSSATTGRSSPACLDDNEQSISDLEIAALRV